MRQHWIAGSSGPPLSLSAAPCFSSPLGLGSCWATSLPVAEATTNSVFLGCFRRAGAARTPGEGEEWAVGASTEWLDILEIPMHSVIVHLHDMDAGCVPGAGDASEKWVALLTVL